MELEKEGGDVTHYQSQLTDAHKDELIYPRP